MAWGLPQRYSAKSDTYAAVTVALHCHSFVRSSANFSWGLKFLTTECKVGAGQVIPGWEEGLLDMCPKEKRILTIPSRMAYGALVSIIKREYIPHLMHALHLRFSWVRSSHPTQLRSRLRRGARPVRTFFIS